MKKPSATAVFTADPEGFREQNAGRPAPQLVREAVQNALDEACNNLVVTVEYDATLRGVHFYIEDDVPGGIRDERLIWTIWMSDKVDSPQKRGRMGRGLKELISVSDSTLIVTAGGPAVQFTRSRGRWERTSPRKHRPDNGTIVKGFTKLWGKRDADEIVAYLRRVRPPEGVTFSVNGDVVKRVEPIESYTLKLPTVIFELQDDGGRIAREPRREATVSLFSEPESWVYEMGIPVEQIDFPLSIDVGQRVPLREKRDTLTEPYRRELFAKILDERVRLGRVQSIEMRDNHVLIAAQAHEHLSVETKQAVTNAWTEGRAFASNPEVTRAATGMHIPVVPLRALPESIREIAKEVGTDVRKVMAEMTAAACSRIDMDDHTEEQARFVRTWTWIAVGVRRSCKVQLSTGRPSAAASFSRKANILTVYVENVPQLVAKPLSKESLSLLIHELAHWNPQEENAHGFEFHSDAEDVGGAVAEFLLTHAAEALERAGAKAAIFGDKA